MSSRLSDGAMLLWLLAASEAAELDYGAIGVEHLLLAVCRAPETEPGEVETAFSSSPQRRKALQSELEALSAALREAGLATDSLYECLRSTLGKGGAPYTGERLHRTAEARLVFAEADGLRKERGGDRMSAGDLAGAVLARPPSAAIEILGRAAPVLRPGSGSEARAADRDPESHAAPDTPYLTRYGRDLTAAARAGELPAVVGRRNELRELAQVLCHHGRCNAVLVGDPGVGKTCVVEGLAQLIASGRVPAPLKGIRVVQLETSAIVAGTSHRGEMEERTRILLEEAASSPDLVLFIDELHSLMGAGHGPMDLSNILKPALARGQIRCVGATTTAEYRQYLEQDAALQRRFQVVWIDEPTRDEAIEMLSGVREDLEAHHAVEIHPDAVEAAVDLTHRHLRDLRLPDKAVEVLDHACSAARLHTLSVGAAQERRQVHITVSDVRAVVARRARLPVERLAGATELTQSQLQARLSRGIKGQDEAISEVVAKVQQARLGLKQRQQPDGVFLFVGPTGVGKTALAQAIARELYDGDHSLIRLDMSEYAEKHSVARLVGAPAGYIRSDEESPLIRQIRTMPHSVVLLDEIEKAHPDVWDVFLQVFDEGRLSDSAGRKADFSDSLIIMTSNVGAHSRTRRIGPSFGDQSEKRGDKEQISSELAKMFPREWLNRLSAIVAFRELDDAALLDVCQAMVDELKDQLEQRNVSVDIAREVLTALVCSPEARQWGPRGLRREFETQVLEPITELLMEIDASEAVSLRVDMDAGRVTCLAQEG